METATNNNNICFFSTCIKTYRQGALNIQRKYERADYKKNLLFIKHKLIIQQARNIAFWHYYNITLYMC